MRRIRLQREGAEPMLFEGDVVTIGRSPSNMVVLSDSRISSLHGEIVQRDGAFFYRDLGSTNGSLVRRRDAPDQVVDGKRLREATLRDGDQLLLGDKTHGVLLEVHLDALLAGPRPSAHTIVARRDVTGVGELGTQIIENPLASRQTLTRLFTFFAQLGAARDTADLAQRVSQFALDLLSKTVFAAVYLKSVEGALERRALTAHDPAHTPVLSGDDLRTWFPDVGAGRAAVALEPPPALSERASQVRMLAACPLPSDDAALGVLVLGRRSHLSDFDLDLLSLVAHHAALHVEKLDLIGKLEEANSSLAGENRELREVVEAVRPKKPPLIGKSSAFIRSLKQSELVAEGDTTVLLLGETGTGKELVARHVHDQSKRKDEPFAAVNCGALADNLLESELFGHVRGAFTGADRDKDGLFRAAHRGTLFLDEIGDVSASLQVKLLRALEALEVTPVGATEPVAVDVRVIAATHRDLQKMVSEGAFREDLYYRVSVFPIELPTLRERPGDAALLAEYFLRHYCERLGKAIPGFDAVALARLEAYAWPGNVRQLQNEIHRAVVLADPDVPLPPEVLSEQVGGLAELPVQTATLKDVMGQLEEQYIRRVLREHGDNRTHTAKALGISRQALTEKLRRYHLVERRA